MDKVLKDWRKVFNENDDRLPTDYAEGDGEMDGEGEGEGRGVDGRDAGGASGASGAGVREDGSPAKKRRRKSRKESVAVQ